MQNLQFDEITALQEDYNLHISNSKESRIESYDFEGYASLLYEKGNYDEADNYRVQAINSREYARTEEEKADKLLRRIIDLRNDVINELGIPDDEIPF